MTIIRGFDIIISIVGLIILSPLFILLFLSIKFSSKEPVFYKQMRVGKNLKDFWLYKFRTMHTGADAKGLLTVGGRDNRITGIGFYLRKFKLDELPQLINVLKGEMSIVGPRPEVRKYVNLYSDEQKKTLNVLPGITDYASIIFRNENDLLAIAIDPEEYYINEIIPKKTSLNFRYINNQTPSEYFTIIAKTIISSIKGK